MEIIQYLTLALAAATLIAALYVAFRIKSVLYLLHQPVVKKMSPQLRLKPVKLDEALNGNRNRDRQGAPAGREGREGERRDGDRNRDGRRDGRPEGDRGPRPERAEGDRGPRRDGDRNRDGRRDGRPEGDRGPRPERTEGDRGPRPERAESDRGPRRDGDRNRDGGRDRRDGNRDGNRESRPPREFSENRESAPAAPSSFNAETTAPAASESHTSLPARRPLPSFDAPAAERSESTAAFRDPAADTFVGAGEDVQHGRRTQLKKKPRFDIDETEATPTV
jgi:hypothetical protein